MRVERHALVEKPLCLGESLVRLAVDAFGLARHPWRAARQRPPEAVSGTRIACPAGRVAVAVSGLVQESALAGSDRGRGWNPAAS